MKHGDFLKAGLAGASLTALPRRVLDPDPQHARRKPNIVFILADDLSMAAPACYGAGPNQGPAPALDALDASGMRGLQEGGYTVPCIANWPGVLPADTEFWDGNPREMA